MAWWLLALGVPQLFWKLQLGAQKVDDFGFKLFIGVLQLTEAERGAVLSSCHLPALLPPFWGKAKPSLPQLLCKGSSAALAAQTL